MTLTMSPTPVAFHHRTSQIQRPAPQVSLQTAAARPYHSRLSPQDSGSSSRRSRIQPTPTDSSDDEDLAPIKLSAEAQAILGEDNAHAALEGRNLPAMASGGDGALGGYDSSKRRSWVSLQHASTGEDGSPAPRVVRVDGRRPSPRATLARDGSFMYKIHDKSTAIAATEHTSKTPANQIRRIRVSGSRSQTRTSPTSASTRRPGSSDDKDHHAYLSPDENMQKRSPDGDQAPVGPSTILRPRRAEEHGVHSTMRVRRIGTGTLLNGPIRRGMIRRQSDDDDEQMGYQHQSSESPEAEQGRRAQEPDLHDAPNEIHNSYQDIRQKEIERQQKEPELQERASPPASPVLNRRSPVQEAYVRPTGSTNPVPLSSDKDILSRPSNSNRKPIFQIPSLPPLESAHDQENEPPPTFKRSKPSAPVLEVHEDQRRQEKDSKDEPKQPQAQQPPSTVSPSRQPLATRSNNTPHRPAPAPPPKMSLIEAATSNAGNARSKKSVHYILNNRTYRRLDCIGRGGSSRVFRIMAENYKIFALKRVNLEEADMAAIAGYKGEIDLLQKLGNVDRVIRLFDYEVNEEKGVLSVMMELGESDFNKMLNEQLKGENAKLDITFTRHYWKEMLECVQAVHNHDIVHSDLKPANFLLVKGQLKLIDFGIANAIQDNTVNVHRENQIGTPNYMSPESLVAQNPVAGSVTGQKILKLGKPSDVWSLGCILYQMTYGQPPFAHIPKQFERIMSIPNPKVEIKFPTTGIGGAVVPFGLIKTLRRCLQRDQSLRPTIKELLSDADPFLNPVAISPDMLGRVIGNVVGYCRKREEALRQQGTLGQEGVSCLPRDEDMRGWPGAFYDKLKQAQEEGSAW